MRLWTAMLGAWLAAGTGTASADGQASGERLVPERLRAPLPISQPATPSAAEDQTPAPIQAPIQAQIQPPIQPETPRRD